MDKRAAVRVPVRVRARCRSASQVVDGLVEDLSRSGLFLRAAKSVGSSEIVEITLELPSSETLQFTAEVVRVQSTGMGLRLVGDPDVVRRSLANFIMRQHATSR